MLSDAWLGLNHQIKEDDRTPALLAFAELATYEKHSVNNAKFKTYMFGFTTYTAFDPLVFSVTSGYRRHKPRINNQQKYRPGNLLMINPQIGFAVNDKVTLTTGVQWINRMPERADNSWTSYRQTQSFLTTGVGFGFNQNSTLNITFKTLASGNNGADFRISWLYTI